MCRILEFLAGYCTGLILIFLFAKLPVFINYEKDHEKPKNNS